MGNSGLFLRVLRGGAWLSLPIEELTEIELRTFMHSRDAGELMRWVLRLVDVVATDRARRELAELESERGMRN